MASNHCQTLCWCVAQCYQYTVYVGVLSAGNHCPTITQYRLSAGVCVQLKGCACDVGRNGNNQRRKIN